MARLSQPGSREMTPGLPGSLPARSAARRRGLATVEAALVFPLLLLLTFGIIEYGWMFLKSHQLTNATRQIARKAAMPDTTSAALQTFIDSQMAQIGLTGKYAMSSINLATPSGQPMTVTVTVPYKQLSITNAPLLPLPINLQAQVTMVKEGP